MNFIENLVYVLGVLCLMVILADYVSKTKIGTYLGILVVYILWLAMAC